ncbi:MAG: hypothetical protein AABY22_36915, partial [Nanoarchaeota archaeon]
KGAGKVIQVSEQALQKQALKSSSSNILKKIFTFKGVPGLFKGSLIGGVITQPARRMAAINKEVNAINKNLGTLPSQVKTGFVSLEQARESIEEARSTINKYEQILQNQRIINPKMILEPEKING